MKRRPDTDKATAKAELAYKEGHRVGYNTGFHAAQGEYSDRLAAAQLALAQWRAEHEAREATLIYNFSRALHRLAAHPPVDVQEET